MNTTAMVLTISGFCFCFVPGVFGWIGITLSITGIIIGIIGLTNTKTSPSGLGMDVASWVYGIITASAGCGFQIKYAAGNLDGMLLPLSLQLATIIAIGLIPIFVTVQILARKKARTAGIAMALILYVAISATGWTAFTLADRAGMLLISG